MSRLVRSVHGPVIAALCCAVLAGCSSTVESDGEIASITVTPSEASVAAGSSLPLVADVRDSDDNPVPGARVSWASEDPSIAAVSPFGVVTGVSTGTALIAASVRGKDAVARISVSATPVARIRLSFTNRSLFVGEVVQLTAEPLDATGEVLPGRVVTFSTSNAAVATVTSGGLVSAVASGGAIITATSEGRSAVASVTVSLVPVGSIAVLPAVNNVVVGQTTQLTADVRDGSGLPLTGRVVLWSTDAAHIATVTSQGLVTAVGPGSARITAAIEGKSASATINVASRPVSAVIVSPGQVTIFRGQSLQLSAIVTDDRGQVLSGKAVIYSTSNPQIASVSTAGLVTGISAGTVTITATSEGAAGASIVTVAPDPVAAVAVTPQQSDLSVGQTVQLSATALDGGGLPLAGHVASWATSSASVATVSSSGVVTGVSPGSATITATIDGQAGAATVNVNVAQGQVAAVIVSPSQATVNVAWSTTLSATARDGSGKPMPGAQIVWTSSDPAIATVSSNGVVTGVAPGSVDIIATSGSASGTASITVQLAPVDRIVVTPSNPSVGPGQTVQLSATLYDQQNNVLTGRSVTWTSGDPSKATVDGSGLVTALKKGNVNIIASSGGKSGSTTVRVQ